ncbi:hypothetical protein GFB49_19335 [Epibacterium sp. SM1979]|uniref:Uncharacterized protein n=1 Tax=Tritonibacter litoralis TaxID=2662264 RepID=A0A843YN06_9RHOB|nr:hypothetical protein [Tritonibacter litoralis]MQQ10612.1 hypothetical protein [Tritonibacter litoralis]
MGIPVKLLFGTAFLFVCLVALAVLNERILPLFGGDRDLAARVMKVVFALFGGVAVGLAQPFFWQKAIASVQARVRQGGSESGFAQWLLRPELKDQFATLGWIALLLALIATALVAGLIWAGRE